MHRVVAAADEGENPIPRPKCRPKGNARCLVHFTSKGILPRACARQACEALMKDLFGKQPLHGIAKLRNQKKALPFQGNKHIV